MFRSRLPRLSVCPWISIRRMPGLRSSTSAISERSGIESGRISALSVAKFTWRRMTISRSRTVMSERAGRAITLKSGAAVSRAATVKRPVERR